MQKYYSSEKNVQILVSLLKQNGIRKIIASPGTTNLAFLGSVQSDSFFQVFSSVDERSAAYMACGMAQESGEAVVLSCTGATASRNYMPGMTEAFYNKLPVLAVTSSQINARLYNLNDQKTDRTDVPRDAALCSFSMQVVKDDDDFFDCEIKTNRAIHSLKRNMPAHIELQTIYSPDFSVKELPYVRNIGLWKSFNVLPELPVGKIAIVLGAHRKFSEAETKALDSFCEKHNAAVFRDHSNSSYNGKYLVVASIMFGQFLADRKNMNADLIIRIGEISGDCYGLGGNAKKMWRVCEDGQIRDPQRRLTDVFEMREEDFFNYYADKNTFKNSYFDECKTHSEKLLAKIPELPFSNLWIAKNTYKKIPCGSTVYLAILNTLRSWSFFPFEYGIETFSNVGGFGIDGGVSSLIGASLVNSEKLYFCITGDLAFFYDMNVLGNHHVGKNLRILLINNGVGTEFKNFNHPCALFEEAADNYMAARGHFGNKSLNLVRHYAEDLGFEYLCAKNKDEYFLSLEKFISAEISDKPVFFEVFTDSENESDALKTVLSLEESTEGKAKNVVKSMIGEKGVRTLKKVLGK